MNTVWLPLAVKNLEDIFDFYAINNIQAAYLIISEIQKNTGILESHPCAGQLVPSLKDFSYPFRALIVYKGRYKVIYYFQDTTIYIYAVVDCWQNPNILKRDYHHLLIE